MKLCFTVPLTRPEEVFTFLRKVMKHALQWELDSIIPLMQSWIRKNLQTPKCVFGFLRCQSYSFLAQHSLERGWWENQTISHTESWPKCNCYYRRYGAWMSNACSCSRQCVPLKSFNKGFQVNTNLRLSSTKLSWKPLQNAIMLQHHGKRSNKWPIKIKI